MSEAPARKPVPQSYWRLAWRRYRRSWLAVAGLAVVLILLMVAFFSPLVANDRPIVCKYDGRVRCPGLVQVLQNIPFAGGYVVLPRPFNQESFDFKRSFDAARGDWAVWAPIPFGPKEIAAEKLQPPSRAHWFGTDDVGRDIAARMVYGTKVAMKVGFISMGIAVVIGLIVGAAAGYFGGWTDILVSRLIEIVMCFPTFFLILAILTSLEPRIEYVMIVFGLTGWTGIARYARGECLKLRDMDFVLAARAMGAGHARIILRHLIPNSLAPVLVSVTFGVAGAILGESALSYLGLGVQPPDPSWGNILESGYQNILTTGHIIIPPCIAIFLAVMAFNLVGDRLRQVTDPRLNSGGE